MKTPLAHRWKPKNGTSKSVGPPNQNQNKLLEDIYLFNLIFSLLLQFEFTLWLERTLCSMAMHAYLVSCPTRLSSSWWWRPEIAPFENCSIWESLHLRIAPFEKCSIWEMLHLRNAPFEKCYIWETCRGGICPSRQSRRECKIFASGVNFSIFTHFLCFFLLKLLKLGEIDGVKFLSWKSGGVTFLTNFMSDFYVTRIWAQIHLIA